MEHIVGGGGPDQDTPSDQDLIKDATSQTFVTDVIEASRERPVIVDFWAPWCEPCKQLGPVLESAVRDAGGAVRLVKVNIDDSQAIAEQLQVRSIPAVFAFVDGQPVDAFMGVQPESQIKAFVAKLVGDGGPGPVEEVVTSARQALEAGDGQIAAEGFSRALGMDPSHPGAIAGMVKCLIAGGDLAAARQLLDSAPPDLPENADIAAATAALKLAEDTSDLGDADELADLVAREPGNHQARYDLAMAHFGAGRHQEALEELLELVRRDRTWDEEAGRRQILEIFAALGQTHPVTVEMRRRLSSLLFS